MLLGVATLWLVYANYHFVSHTLESIVDLYSKVASKSYEQIKEERHESIGYQYIRDIVKLIPEKHVMPLTKYYDYTKLIHLHLPFYRNHIDDRLLIGVGLHKRDFKPSIISAGVPEERQAGEYQYVFRTQTDYDTLTSLEFEYDQVGSDPRVDVAFYPKLTAHAPLESWQIALPVGQSSKRFVIPRALNQFSLGRGATDFYMVIKTEDSAKIKKILIRAIKVNLREYKIINRSGKHFLAIKKAFLKEIRSEKRTDWNTYLKAVSNVP